MNEATRSLASRLPRPVKRVAKAILFPRYHFRIFLNDMKALLRITSYATHVLFVAGYPKSGTTWVENFISHIPGYNPRILAGSREIIRQHELPVDAFSSFPKYGYSAVKTHINPSARNIDVLLKNGIRKVLVMYRDPRDIIVSNYYYVLKNNPWRRGDSEYADYAAMSKQEGLSHSMELILDDYCAWVEGWMNTAKSHPEIQCLFVRYEDLRARPESVFADILAFYEIALSASQFSSVMLACNPSSVASICKEPGRRSTKRKGASGDWRTELDEQQQQYIKQKAGKCLIDLGYEQDSGW